MKLYIAFALIAAVAAFPEPIDLPAPEQPALEDVLQDVQPVTLPKAEPPAYEAQESVFQPIDISPMLVPEEVMEAVRLAQLSEEMPVDANPDVLYLDAVAALETLVPKAEPEFFYIPSEVAEAVDAAIENAVEDFAVRFVDNAEEVAPMAEEAQNFDAVRIVDIAEDAPAPENALVNEEIAAGELEAVRVAQPPFDVHELARDAVRVVDMPIRGKVFDDPLLR